MSEISRTYDAVVAQSDVGTHSKVAIEARCLEAGMIEARWAGPVAPYGQNSDAVCR